MLVVALVVAAASADASDWADRVRELSPDGVTITQVEETPDALRLVGRARTNADVAALMRAIGAADLGTPELQMVRPEGDVRHFVLVVKAAR